jgi:SAM-dependent methyltransferase
MTIPPVTHISNEHPETFWRRLSTLASRGIRLLRHPISELHEWRSRRGFKHLLQTASGDYQTYLGMQFRRSYARKDYPLLDRTRQLVEQGDRVIGLAGKSVLCVGCRNTAEIDLLRSTGARFVAGIDLYSVRSDILVMDMHHMDFPDDQFDVVYTCHALEHAYDPSRAAREIVRVLHDNGFVVIEVPVGFATDEVERNDFGSLEGLQRLFGPNVREVLYRDDVLLTDGLEHSFIPAIRNIFTVRK